MATSNKNFKVKNGLEVGTTTVVASIDSSGNANIAGNLTANTGFVSADTFRLDTTFTGGTTQPGEIAWDVDEGTVMFQLADGAVTHRIGQQLDIRVVNNTGSTISEGAVVYINGSSGQEPTIALANAATEGASSKTIGVVTHQGGIANAASGYICISGIMRGVDVGAYTAGTPLWLSNVAGVFTDTKPTPPDNGVFIGWVVKAGNAGSILVAIQNGYEVDELHDVKYTSLATNDILQRTANNLWENKTLAGANIANLAATGLQTFSGPITITGNANATTFNGSGAGLTSIPTANLSGTISNAQLANSTITIAGKSVALGGSNTIALDDLSDVAIASASAGQQLLYNGTGWVNTETSHNYLINGAFDIWQRGTSFTADGYCADRWYFNETGTCIVTQETVEVPTGYMYSLKANATTVSDSVDIYQCLEQTEAELLRGKTVTFSCYIKMDANMISQTGDFELKTYYSNTTDARISQTTVVNNTANAASTVLTKSSYTGWALASHTFVVPSDAVGLRVSIEPPLTVSPTAAVYWITGAQLELGSVATPFRRSSPTYGQELAACQRYYVQFTAGSVGGNFAFFAPTIAYSSIAAAWAAMLPDTMRTIPSISTSGNFRLVGSTTVNVTSIALYGVGSMPQPVSVTVSVASGLTSGSGYILSANNDATATVKFDSEL